MRPDWKMVSERFQEALNLDEPGRAQLLERLQAEAPALAAEVRSLLKAHSEAENFLEKPPGLSGPEEPLAVGDRVPGDFTIVEVLGRGSFATVYLAEQRSLQRRVALKVSPNLGQEATTMAHLEHDNIVKIYQESFDPERGIRILCMQYVPGPTLERCLDAIGSHELPLRTGAELLEVIDHLSPSSAAFIPAALKDREMLAGQGLSGAILWLGLRLTDALGYAHRRGVLHLDVKPANILLTPYGRPMLSDFNISINLQAREEKGPGVFGGTFRYMAPEHREAFDRWGQKEGEKIPPSLDHRADLYSLGMVLKEVFETTGALRAELPGTAEIEQILKRSIAPEPSERYQSAEELSSALAGARELLEVLRTLPPLGWVMRFTERYRLFAIGLLVLLPNLVGSAVNIGYNQLRIVSRLSEPQGALFRELCLFYNCLAYPICIAYFLRQLFPLRQCLRPGRWFCDLPIAKVEPMRQHVLGLPRAVFLVTTLGWMPGSVIFPLGLWLVSGKLPPAAIFHFFVSFTLSWLISTTYALLFVQFLVLRLLYPRLWLGQKEIRRTAARELQGFDRGRKVLHLLAGFVPLVGAALVILAGPDTLDAASYQTYRWLVGLLIGLGMVGLLMALRASDLMARVLYALTGNDAREGEA